LLSAWAGLRPLVKSSEADVVHTTTEDSWRSKITTFFQGRIRWLAYKVNGKKKKSSTAAISRNHVIEVLPQSGLISLMGGKWTAYRVQGEETTDRIFKEHPVLL